MKYKITFIYLSFIVKSIRGDEFISLAVRWLPQSPPAERVGLPVATAPAKNGNKETSCSAPSS